MCVFCAIGILFSLLRRVVVNIMCEGGLVAEGERGGEGGAVGADAEKEIAGFGLADVGVGGRMGEGEVEVGERVGLARKARFLADKHLLHKQLNATQFPFPTGISAGGITHRQPVPPQNTNAPRRDGQAITSGRIIFYVNAVVTCDMRHAPARGNGRRVRGVLAAGGQFQWANCRPSPPGRIVPEGSSSHW